MSLSKKLQCDESKGEKAGNNHVHIIEHTQQKYVSHGHYGCRRVCYPLCSDCTLQGLIHNAFNAV